MIIETKDDVVRLSGSLHKNQWMTIKAAANLLLHHHPQGIIVDCAQLVDISEDGAKTFLEAMRDIQGAKARIVVANLPEQALAVIKSVPGVRSQLPIAESVEAARASLRVAARPVPASSRSTSGPVESIILVPLVPGLDLSYGAHLAGRLARVGRAEVRLVYFLVVPRNLPLNAPLASEEQAAQAALDRAIQLARQHNVPVSPYVERVRDASEGIVAAIKSHGAALVVIGASDEPEGGERHEAFHALVDTLLHRAPCEVVVGRLKPAQ